MSKKRSSGQRAAQPNKPRSGSGKGGGGKRPDASERKPSAKTSGRRKSRLPFVIGTLLVVGVVVAIAAAGGGSGGTAGQVSAEEAKYLGRLLPEGYEAPKVADATLYSSSVGMTRIETEQDDSRLSVRLRDVVSNSIVRFDYARPGGETLPLLAYVKPSGRLFVGVSYCPPCEGEGQTIAGDGTLTCDSCGTKRNLESQAGLSGACKLYPLDELPATVAGDSVTVEKAVIDSWTPQPLDRKVG